MSRILLFLLFVTTLVYSQQNDYTWTYVGQQMGIESYANLKFVLSAEVKVYSQDKTASAALYVNILDSKKESIFFDNMLDRAIISKEWSTYQIKGEVPKNASKINLGLIADNNGDFFVDNFCLKIQQKDGSWIEFPLKNSSFETPFTNNDVPIWKQRNDNIKFKYELTNDTPKASEGNYALKVSIRLNNSKNEKPVFVKSKKTNSKGEAVLVKNIHIVDVKTGESHIASILIQDKKIQKINKNITPIDDHTIVIDGSGKWLIPGLIDSHIHLFQSGGIYTRPDAINLTQYRPYEEERKWLRQYAPDLLKRYLKLGITSVVDMGGPLYNYEIRDTYNDNTQYPNLFLTGPLISTYQPDAFKIDDAPIIKAHTAEEAIALVKKQLPFQPDFIKIWFIKTKDMADNYKIVEATINESHKHNIKVAVHATELATAKLAIKAGADILVHSVEEPIDDEFINLITKHKVSYIPTLEVSANYHKAFGQNLAFSQNDLQHGNPYPIGSFLDYKHLENASIFERYKKRTIARTDYVKKEDSIAKSNLKILNDKNISIATGTDAGNIGTLHATSFEKELIAMQEAGLSNADILKASTLNAAKMLGKEAELGSIEEGKLADLVILNQNPLDNINALNTIDYVIKGGSLFTPENIIPDNPEMLVQKQLVGYNLRNLDFFLDQYSDDIEIYDFPNILRYKGKNTIRKEYKPYFENHPDIHCEILSRTAIGNKVIDHEQILYKKGSPLNKVIAIYTIENGKISKVHFISE